MGEKTGACVRRIVILYYTPLKCVGPGFRETFAYLRTLYTQRGRACVCVGVWTTITSRSNSSNSDSSCAHLHHHTHTYTQTSSRSRGLDENSAWLRIDTYDGQHGCRRPRAYIYMRM